MKTVWCPRISRISQDAKPEDRDEKGRFRPGCAPGPGRSPSKAARLAAVIEGLRQRFDKATAEEAIAEAVKRAPEPDVCRYVLAILPKQEDPDTVGRPLEVRIVQADGPALIGPPMIAAPVVGAGPTE